MSREVMALLVLVVVAVAVLVLVARAWRRRTRRDADLPAPVGEPPPGSIVRDEFPGLYVATTRHDEPLERLAVAHLGFRSKVTVTVTDAGVALDMPAAPPLFVAADRLLDVDQATVAIDRVVEREGLTRLSWRIQPDTVVDSYFRPQEASARALVDAIRPIIPAAPETVPETTTGIDT